MSERDPLRDLLREWKSPEPSAELDERVSGAYRAAFREQRVPLWTRLLNARISVPVPVLLAAVAGLALFLWLRPASAPSAPRDTADVVTKLNASGFVPLPNGDARIVPVTETH